MLLLADGLGNLFVSIVGSFLALGPVVAIGPLEAILKESSNRLARRVVGKELFPAEQEDSHVREILGRDFENLLEGGTQEKNETWSLARDFTLTGEEDWKSFPLILKAGQAVRGYVDADEGVWAYILAASSFTIFESENGFRPVWDTQGNWARVDFVPERSGIYYLVVANFDAGEGSRFYEEDDNVLVELRLRF